MKDALKGGLIAAGVLAVMAGSIYGARQFARSEERRIELAHEQARRDAWDAPCADIATLLATTAGSPDKMTCPNRQHRMRVQVSTTASNEEAAALVVCECAREQTR